jgi:GWxTD domain-containing protein
MAQNHYPARSALNLFIPALAILAVAAFTSGCGTSLSVRQDPTYKTFFEKTRLIMTGEEVDIYEHLPDTESRQAFIEEFWKSRDPESGTEENEARTEFENRVLYANKWFGTGVKSRRRTNWEPAETDNGWTSDRGRLYIILGPPDEIYLTDGDDTHFLPEGASEDRWRYDEDATMEIWYYFRYQVTFGFSKHSISLWVMDLIDAQGRAVLEEAKLNWIVDSSVSPKRALRFKAGRTASGIKIRVPASRISFKEEEGKLVAGLEARIAVYKDYKKLEDLRHSQRYAFSEEELVAVKELVLEVPFQPVQGRYYLDITLEETTAPSVSRYRSGLTFAL